MIKIYSVNASGYKTYHHYDEFNFPGGEKHVKIKSIDQYTIYLNVEYKFDNNESIITLMLLCDAAKRMGLFLNYLHVDRMPFAQQDRVAENGEPLSIAVFALIINSLNFNHVYINDPHSDVTPALIDNCFAIPQWMLLKQHFNNKDKFWLVSVDGGSLKKIYKLQEELKDKCLGVIECSKHRNTTDGKLTECKVHWPYNFSNNDDIVIVDDIAIGGQTFINVSKSFIENGHAGKRTLMVSHGIFSKGLDLLGEYFDEIYTKDGQVK